ncbi:Uncharacterised protein [Mycobacteroides abscessus subsp. massiliense]|uniref:hypothetical protein n=1 Tax=Mycobacteroides abscessus TaxID=36809 RepID=UPI0009A7F6F8|nr:hypothetical protein [Mycobacteroides abscessus]SLE83915.1 Uncharacterised protein [Mycobacteroides abscessus subsp. massiliense]
MSAHNKYVHVSKKVAALLTPPTVDTVHETAGKYLCTKCGNPGDATKEHTSVVLVVQPGTHPRVVKAHNRCMASQVIELRGGGGNNVAGVVDKTGETDPVISVTAIWPSRDGSEAYPGILIDMPTAPTIVHVDSGEPEDIVVSGFLMRGWALILGIYQDLPTPADFTVKLGPGGTGTIIDAGETDEHGRPRFLLDELPKPDPVWIALAQRHGHIRVLAGNLDIAGAPAGAAEAALRAAVRAGHVVGALIPVQ